MFLIQGYAKYCYHCMIKINEKHFSSFSTLRLQELMGRPVRLKFSVKTIDGSGDEKEGGDISEGQPEEA